MNISLRLLKYVTAAADCGNVTEAARRLQVSQPSVSAAIADLEKILGIPIFVRHHAKGVTLTPAGQLVMEEARLLLKHAEDFAKTAEALGAKDRGEITIGSHPVVAARFMPALMLEFAARHPLIDLRLEEADQERLIADLSEGRIELAVAYDLDVPPSFQVTPLLSLAPVAVLPTQHRLARAASVSLTDLEREPLILEECPAVSEYVMGLFDAVGIKPNIAARLKSFEVIRSFVGRGRGYAIHIVNPLVTTTYDGQKLAVKPLSDELPPAQIASVTLGLQNLRPAVKIFADFLQTALASKRSHSDEAASAAASPA